MTELISRIHIHGFRGFSDLAVGPFGRVNLITGRNNSGKSSLLEAIRILATGGSSRTIFEILNFREEMTPGESDRTPSGGPAPFCSLFSGFPEIGRDENGFVITASGTIPVALSSVAMNVRWFTRKLDPVHGIASYEPAAADLFEDVDSSPALEIILAGRKRVLPLDRIARRAFVSRMDSDALPLPCVYLDPFSSRSTSHMGALWDAIALTDAEHEIVRAIRAISDEITAVSMIGSEDPSSRRRTAIAKSTRFPLPVPLRTFGDGVNRLFGIILSLCNAKNGVVLIDEIENGLHYSVQTSIWKTIVRLARDLNVQVFATSHSWDCVRAFQEAAAESPADGVLIRLAKRNDSVAATLFTESELTLATRDQIEVR